MKNLTTIFLIIILILSSCIDKEKTLDNGVLIKYLKNGSGKIIQDGEVMLLNLQYFDYDGTELFNRGGGDEPVVLQKDSAWDNNGPVYEVLSYLKNGDSIFFQLTLEQFFNNAPTGVTVPDSIKEELMSFYLGVKDIMSQDEFKDYQRDLYEKMQMENAKREKEMEEQNVKQLPMDLEIIDNYLNENNIDAVKTESGLRYVVTKEGSGPNATPGDVVSVHYTGMLLDGTVFDSSEGREPIQFPLGQSRVIKAWDEGISYFNKGSKGTLYIPSPLGYGPNGTPGGPIPPNAILIFDIELVSF